MEENKQEEQAKNVFYNPHDIIGVKGMIDAQSKELNRKMLELKIENEIYLRSHPELETMVTLFLKKVLDEQPENVLQFAGNFFDKPSLKDTVNKAMQKGSQ